MKKLRILVRHAYDNVPFYHEKFKEVGLKPEDVQALADIQKLPITTKDELKAYTPEKTIAENYKADTLYRGQTGGTTGKPFTYFKERKTIFHEIAALCWFRSWCGFLGFKQAFFRLLPYVPWSKEFKEFLIGWLICDDAEQTLHKYAHWLRGLKPTFLEGSPLSFYALANFLMKEGFPAMVLPIVFTTSEPLFSFQRQVIESTFNCRVFNHYACNEIVAIAQECEEHSGLHINAEDRILEFIKRGEVVTSGEVGEIVITDLENYAMPFIRYNTNDVGVPVDDSCSCGRQLPLIKEIYGRVWDLIISVDGTFIPSDIFAQFIFFRDRKWMQRFQIIQPTREKLLIKIVRSPEYKPENLEFILREVQKHLGKVELRTEFVESISPLLSGKHRFVVSEASNEFFKQPKK